VIGLRVLGEITDPGVVHFLLDRLGLPAEPPRVARARDPTEAGGPRTTRLRDGREPRPISPLGNAFLSMRTCDFLVKEGMGSGCIVPLPPDGAHFTACGVLLRGCSELLRASDALLPP